MKQQKIYPRESEVQAQSKEPLYAKLLRAAKVATEDAASVADVLRVCLNKVCDCTQWPFAHALILTEENELGGRSAKEVWRVPFPDLRRFQDKALRMNRLRSGIDWRLQMVTSARPTVLFDLEQELDSNGRHAARELGLRSALGMPVLAGENVSAICEFFSCDVTTTRELDQRKEEIAKTAYTKEHTALLIIDPYNDFMSEGGKLFERTKETAMAVSFSRVHTSTFSP